MTPQSPTSGFKKLPPEIRLMIWAELLDFLPPPKVVSANAPSNHATVRFETQTQQTHEQRQTITRLSQICWELRNLIHSIGGFIVFPNKATAKPHSRTNDVLWWNSKLDTLVFDNNWEAKHDELLAPVQGLDLVKHIVLSTAQASNVGYEVVRTHEDILLPRDQRSALPLAINLRFQSPEVTVPWASWDAQPLEPLHHYIPRFFAGLKTLTLSFAELCSPQACTKHDWANMRPCEMVEPPEQIEKGCGHAQVTFRLGPGAAVSVAAAVESMQRLRECWVGVWESLGGWGIPQIRRGKFLTMPGVAYAMQGKEHWPSEGRGLVTGTVQRFVCSDDLLAGELDLDVL